MNPPDHAPRDSTQPESGPVFVIHAPRIAAASEGLEWIKSGFRFFMEAPGDWIAISVVGALIMFGISSIPIAGFLNSILGPVWIAGIMLGCKAQEDGYKLEIKYLFAGFGPRAGQLAICGLLVMVAQMVLWLLFLGSVILPIVLGGGSIDFNTLATPSNLIWLAIKLLVLMALLLPLYAAAWFAPLLMLFGNLPIKASLQLSLQACMINVWSFLVYGQVMLLMVIVAAIPLGLGMLVAGPVIFVSIYVSFKAIFVE